MQLKKQIQEPVKTVLVITVGFLFVALLFKLKWPLYAAFIIGTLGVISNWLAVQIHFFWMKLAWLLSKIVPNILMTIIFFLLLTPLAFLSRIFADKNALTLKNNDKSLFKTYNKVFDKKSFENPW